MIKKGIITLILAASITAAIDGISGYVKFTSSGVELINTIKTKDSINREVYKLADLTYQDNSPASITDMTLSFNYPANRLVKDDTDKYAINNSSYELITGKGVLGGGGAGFFKRDHRVEIQTSENLFLGNCDDLGSFTIEFRFFPISLKDESVLFSRIGYLSGQKNGLEIALNKEKISVRLHRVFKDQKGRRFNIFLNKGKNIQTRKWYHFSLSFNKISGKLAKYLDGVENEVVYVSENGEPFINVNKPSFTCIDKPALIIGKDYYGYIDEIRIAHTYAEDLENQTNIAYKGYRDILLNKSGPQNRGGLMISPVYSFPSTGASITLFKWDEILKHDAFVWMEFRTSDHLFRRYSDNIKWYRLGNNQKNIYLKKAGDEYLRGKYYQWKAHLIPSPDGEYSPTIYNIELQYRLDPPPNTPIFFEAPEAGDGFVRLKWKKNVDHDISGYKIYYGIRSGEYNGVIGYINGQRITNQFNKSGDYISVDIKAGVIKENKKKNKNNILSYPEFKNNILYFFAISAYDSYKVDTAYNHESPQSREIKARPFAGSEID